VLAEVSVVAELISFVADQYISGLGKGLLAAYLLRPNNIMIAAVRDTNSDTAKALSSLPCHSSSKLIVIKIDSRSYSDPVEAIKLLQTTHKIDSLDVVLSNAGISNDFEPAATASISALEDHIAVNGIAPLVLFQAVFPLLTMSSKPRFIIMGSAMGSISGMDERAAYPMYSYGASKALAHYTSRKIHFTYENVISFALDPG
jgi:norsolorinic acid ketoreductase